MKQTESIDADPKTVVFRKDKSDGAIVALFPLVPSAMKSGSCYILLADQPNDYGSAEYEDIISGTYPAIASEYSDFHDIITSKGHSLIVKNHEELTGKRVSSYKETGKGDYINSNFSTLHKW